MLDYIKLSDGTIIEHGMVSESPTIGDCRACGYPIYQHTNGLEDEEGNLFCDEDCYHVFNELYGYEDLDLDYVNTICDDWR